jgi:hypothetical protein
MITSSAMAYGHPYNWSDLPDAPHKHFDMFKLKWSTSSAMAYAQVIHIIQLHKSISLG